MGEEYEARHNLGDLVWPTRAEQVRKVVQIQEEVVQILGEPGKTDENLITGVIFKWSSCKYWR